MIALDVTHQLIPLLAEITAMLYAVVGAVAALTAVAIGIRDLGRELRLWKALRDTLQIWRRRRTRGPRRK